MADDGWGAAQPEEYIEEGTQGAPGQHSLGWGIGPTTTYMQAPQGQNIPLPQANQVQMGGNYEKQTGTVKTWVNEKGFGFITKPDGSDVFVHHSAVYAQGKASLEVGENVEFHQVISDDGRSKATDVTGPGGVHVKGSSEQYDNGGGRGATTVCRNFQRTGNCRFGMGCRFVHGSGGVGDTQSPYGGGGGGANYGGGAGNGFAARGKKPCFNFQNNGHCKFGDRCRFGHE